MKENKRKMGDCKGCYIQYICVVTKWSKTCPCRICIIKGVCTNICPDRINFPDMRDIHE